LRLALTLVIRQGNGSRETRTSAEPRSRL
jgi:hypothetical protein